MSVPVLDSDRWRGIFSRAFLIGLVVWIVSSALLGIPHGPAHSIESPRWIEALRDISLPIWLGSFIGLLAALVMRASTSLRSRSDSLD